MSVDERPLEDEGAAAGAPAPRDPLTALLEPPTGWRARLDELTGGLPLVPMGLDRRGRVVAAGLLVLLVAVTVVVCTLVGRGSDGGAAGSISGSSTGDDLPRARPGTTAPSTGPRPAGTAAGTSAEPAGGSAPAATIDGIWVAAAGAVRLPGLYRLRSGARVSELVGAAGGLAPDADADRLNLAAPLLDGARLYVPRRGERDIPAVVVGDGAPVPTTAGTGPTTAVAPSPDHPVDLNTASAAELDALPGVGPSTAAAIVAYREAHGPFRAVDDLGLVRGIGPAKLEQLRPLVTT